MRPWIYRISIATALGLLGPQPAICQESRLPLSEILTNLFTNRLLDRMREKSGASYAPQVVTSWPVDLDSGGSITALGQLQPQDVPTYFRTVDEIAADLVANPPGPDELARVTEPLKQQITRAATSSAFFMYQLEGATADPSRFGAIRTILSDYTVTTPAAMQALAAEYLRKDHSWRVAIVPAGQGVAGAPASSGTGSAAGR